MVRFIVVDLFPTGIVLWLFLLSKCSSSGWWNEVLSLPTFILEKSYNFLEEVNDLLLHHLFCTYCFFFFKDDSYLMWYISLH